jgi:uncharacterized protein YcbK (DUF882 family)
MNTIVTLANELAAGMQEGRLTENFLWEEIVCACGQCIRITPAVFTHMARLQAMRIELAAPIHVNSGYRCPKHNAAVGGAPQSWHMMFATDVRPSDGSPYKLKLMYRMALQLGFGGIGLYENKGFIHLDMRPGESRWRE